MSVQLKVVSSSPYRIEKNIPIAGKKRIGEIEYPFADMNRGDSFLAPTSSEDEYKRVANALHRQSRQFAKLFGKDYEFTVRRVDGGIRCWRIK